MRIYVHSEINIQGGVLWLRDCRKEACAAHKALAESFGRQQPRPCIISQLQEAVPSFRRLLSFRLLCRSCADTFLSSLPTHLHVGRKTKRTQEIHKLHRWLCCNVLRKTLADPTARTESPTKHFLEDVGGDAGPPGKQASGDSDEV